MSGSSGGTCVCNGTPHSLHRMGVARRAANTAAAVGPRPGDPNRMDREESCDSEVVAVGALLSERRHAAYQVQTRAQLSR